MFPSFITTVGFVPKRTIPSSGERTTIAAASSDGTDANYLDGGDPVSLHVDVTTDSFIIAGWIKIPDFPPALSDIITNGDSDNGEQYWSLIVAQDGTFRFATETSSSGVEQVVSTDTISLNSKTFVVAWFDPSTPNLNLKINNGTTKSHTVTIVDPAPNGGVKLFSNNTSGTGLNGILDEIFFCKNPADLAAALSLINTTIYNNGNGTHYSTLTSGNKTTLGLVSWWGLDEASGVTRLDLQGSNNLTLNGTITQVTALTS